MIEDSAVDARQAFVRLQPADIVPGAPLEWAIVSADGTPLFAAGTLILDEATRDFIFKQFDPHRTAGDAAPRRKPEEPSEETLVLDDLGLSIGGRIGVRVTGGSGSAMYASRVIGFSNARRNGERSLFVTQPLMTGFDPLDLTRGELVDLVALTGKGVFRFACTVDALCREPFSYVVLSAPGTIRRLRTRKFVRMPTRMAACYAIEGDEGALKQPGRVSDISPYGMSLTVATPNARVGDRLALSFRFATDGVDVQVDTIAIVRHVGDFDASTQSAAYGLEFESLEPAQRIALKSFMAEHG
ncbi:flagellar brake protein [Caballeronia sp. GAFFF2]|uniref:flagellar brake protein n=1 Tax=Caballeronia sp. GAFFF2 TaxID=2921741 RepID=UPI002027B7AD|nr:flagellar brake protein [Caballeronia sp. GAFFF2]